MTKCLPEILVEQCIGAKRLAYNHASGTYEERSSNDLFIKGPIPLNWLIHANSLPGKAGAVAIALWFLVGVQRGRVVKLTGEVERVAGCGRKALYKALVSLQAAGLIGVSRRAGGRPVVEVLVTPGLDGDFANLRATSRRRNYVSGDTERSLSGGKFAESPTEMSDIADGEQR